MNEKLNEWIFLSGQDFQALESTRKQLGAEGRVALSLQPDLDIKHNMATLLNCDEVMFFPDWQNSRECCLHHKMALELGMKIAYVPVPRAPKW